MRTVTFIALNTALGAGGGFLTAAFALFLTGVEIDFDRQKYAFLSSVLIFGTCGFIAGCINSGLALRVLACIFVAEGNIRRFIDNCIIKLINVIGKLFNID